MQSATDYLVAIINKLVSSAARPPVNYIHAIKNGSNVPINFSG